MSQVNQKMITSSTMGREVGAEPRGVFQLGGRDEKQHCGGAPAREGETLRLWKRQFDKYLLVLSD